MRNRGLWLGLAAAILVILFFIYRGWHRPDLNVEPHAAKEIEKAKRR